VKVFNLTDLAPHPQLTHQKPTVTGAGHRMIAPGESLDLPLGMANALRQIMGDDVAVGEVPDWYAEAKGTLQPKPTPKTKRRGKKHSD
jgi:hypothetical protein